MIETPKFENENWLGSKKGAKKSTKNVVIKKSKAIDKKTDKTSLAKQRLNLKRAKKDTVKTMRVATKKASSRV